MAEEDLAEGLVVDPVAVPGDRSVGMDEEGLRLEAEGEVVVAEGRLLAAADVTAAEGEGRLAVGAPPEDAEDPAEAADERHSDHSWVVLGLQNVCRQLNSDHFSFSSVTVKLGPFFSQNTEETAFPTNQQSEQALCWCSLMQSHACLLLYKTFSKRSRTWHSPFCIECTMIELFNTRLPRPTYDIYRSSL